MSADEDRRALNASILAQIEGIRTDAAEREERHFQELKAVWVGVNENSNRIGLVSERVTGIEAREGECARQSRHQAGIISTVISAIVAGVIYGFSWITKQNGGH